MPAIGSASFRALLSAALFVHRSEFQHRTLARSNHQHAQADGTKLPRSHYDVHTLLQVLQILLPVTALKEQAKASPVWCT
jgi:hypothetical protein